MLKNIIQYNSILTELYNYDAPVADQKGFQDPATPIMEGIIDLHHDLAFFLVLISIFVSWLLLITVVQFNWTNRAGLVEFTENWGLSVSKYKVRDMFKTHHTMLEIVWTIIPSVILMLIALPSFALLYAMDEVLVPEVTVKAIGHQWFWSYEYSDSEVRVYKDKETGEELGRLKYKILHYYDSYMVTENDLSFINMYEKPPENGEYYVLNFNENTRFLRLLDVDNRVVLPLREKVRFLVTSTDVLHSWAVPSLGIKVDACPGRLNQTSIYIKREGIFYGQCSEICGVNHAFMPIVVICVADWISETGESIFASAGEPMQYTILVQDGPHKGKELEIEWNLTHDFTQIQQNYTYYDWLRNNGNIMGLKVIKN